MASGRRPALNRRTSKLTIRQHAPGDGTVLPMSTVLDERLGWSWTPELVSPISCRDVTFVFSDHLTMTRAPAFSDNILFRLLESPRYPGSCGIGRPLPKQKSRR